MELESSYPSIYKVQFSENKEKVGKKDGRSVVNVIRSVTRS